MPKVIGIGKQRYDRIIENNLFYIDKTMFIKEWWENQDDVTLITRPRRFGKTLNMDMLKCFFSNEYKDRGDLFEGLDIWKEEKYREIQGTYPIIFLSFAKIKQNTYKDAIAGIKRIICDEIQKYIFLKDWDGLADAEKNNLKNITYGMDDVSHLDIALQQAKHNKAELEKGKGGMAASPLGPSRKGSPCLNNIQPGQEEFL